MPSPQRRRCGGRDPGGKPGTLWSEEQKPCAHDQGRPVHSPQGKEERRPGRGRGRGGGTLGAHLGSTPGTGRFLSSIPPPGPRGATVHEGHERRRGRRPRPGPAPARSWLAAPPRPPPQGPCPLARGSPRGWLMRTRGQGPCIWLSPAQFQKDALPWAPPLSPSFTEPVSSGHSRGPCSLAVRVTGPGGCDWDSRLPCARFPGPGTGTHHPRATLRAPPTNKPSFPPFPPACPSLPQTRGDTWLGQPCWASRWPLLQLEGQEGRTRQGLPVDLHSESACPSEACTET